MKKMHNMEKKNYGNERTNFEFVNNAWWSCSRRLLYSQKRTRHAQKNALALKFFDQAHGAYRKLREKHFRRELALLSEPTRRLSATDIQYNS